MRAFLFPGQGSQSVGMGHEVYDAFPCARDVFEEVDEALGQNLSKIIFEGPEEELVLTENAQPALMTVSLAILRVLEKEGGINLINDVKCVAGHSLGEYSALVAAGFISLADGARLTKIRGKAMQEAAPKGECAMAAILGLELETVEEIVNQATDENICCIANDNCPGQVVVSGHNEAVEQAIKLAQEKGAKRAVMLNVSAPFHCLLMQPAAVKVQKALENIQVQNPVIPLITNVNAVPTQNAQDICRFLIEQITGRVRWRESIEAMVEMGVSEVVEIGAGKVLTGLCKRIDSNVKAIAINTPHDIESFLQSYQNLAAAI